MMRPVMTPFPLFGNEQYKAARLPQHYHYPFADRHPFALAVFKIRFFNPDRVGNPVRLKKYMCNITTTNIFAL